MKRNQMGTSIVDLSNRHAFQCLTYHLYAQRTIFAFSRIVAFNVLLSLAFSLTIVIGHHDVRINRLETTSLLPPKIFIICPFAFEDCCYSTGQVRYNISGLSF